MTFARVTAPKAPVSDLSVRTRKRRVQELQKTRKILSAGPMDSINILFSVLDALRWLKTLQGVRWEVGGDKEIIYNSQSYKKELKLAIGIDVIVDHIEIHPPSLCKPCKLSMKRRVINVSSQRKLVSFQKFGHALQVEIKSMPQTSVK